MNRLLLGVILAAAVGCASTARQNPPFDATLDGTAIVRVMTAAAD